MNIFVAIVSYCEGFRNNNYNKTLMRGELVLNIAVAKYPEAMIIIQERIEPGKPIQNCYAKSICQDSARSA